MTINVRPIVKKAQVAILGALGHGAAGSPSNNNSAILNAAPIGASNIAHFESAAFVSNTGRVRVAVTATLSKNGGTLAAGDGVTFTISRDISGVPVTVGGDARVTATTDGADVVATAGLEWIDSVVPGVSHTYAVVTTIAGGAHTGGFLVGEAVVVLTDV